MRQIIIPLFAAILWPVSLASTTSRTILSPPKTSMISALDVACVARTIYAEARGESQAGQIAVVSVIQNRAKRYGISIHESTRKGFCKGGKLTPELIELAANVLRQETTNDYLYFYNPKKASDKKWLTKTLHVCKDTIGAHVFF